MKLIAQNPVHGVEAGQAFEVDGAEACRLIAYGYAIPADDGPVDPPKFGAHSKRCPGDAMLAAVLRAKAGTYSQRTQSANGDRRPRRRPRRRADEG